MSGPFFWLLLAALGLVVSAVLHRQANVQSGLAVASGAIALWVSVVDVDVSVALFSAAAAGACVATAWNPRGALTAIAVIVVAMWAAMHPGGAPTFGGGAVVWIALRIALVGLGFVLVEQSARLPVAHAAWAAAVGATLSLRMDDGSIVAALADPAGLPLYVIALEAPANGPQAYAGLARVPVPLWVSWAFAGALGMMGVAAWQQLHRPRITRMAAGVGSVLCLGILAAFYRHPWPIEDPADLALRARPTGGAEVRDVHLWPSVTEAMLDPNAWVVVVALVVLALGVVLGRGDASHYKPRAAMGVTASSIASLVVVGALAAVAWQVDTRFAGLTVAKALVWVSVAGAFWGRPRGASMATAASVGAAFWLVFVLVEGA
jgi:hypothetical protein